MGEADRTQQWLVVDVVGDNQKDQTSVSSQPGPGRIEIYTTVQPNSPARNDRDTGSRRSSLFGILS